MQLFIVRNAAILFIFLQIIFAQETTKTYYQKDTVVVIGNRYEIPLKHHSSSYSVIPQKVVTQLSTHSILQAVEVFSPSAFILDKKILGYGVGAAGGGGIYMRGLGGKPNTGVLVLVNGHPDLMGIFGHPLPDVYGMDDVNKVEILSGPSSTVFGSNAMGGVINLTTGPDYNKLINVSLEGGSFNTFKSKISFARLVEDIGFYFTLSKKSSSGHIDKTDFSSYHFQAGVDYKLNSNWHLTLQGRYVPYEFDDPARNENIEVFDIYGKIKRGMAELILKNSFDSIKGSSQVYTNLGSHKFFDGFESDDFTIGFSTYQQVTLNSKFSLALGGDLINYGGKSNADNQDHKLTSAGFYGLLHYSPCESLYIKSGFRFQHLSLGINKFLPDFGISFSPYHTLTLFANYQSGYRFPTLRDLYLFPISNPNLTEEEVKTVELGVDILFSEYYNLKVTYFNNKVTDMIQTVANPSAPPPVKLFNSGEADQWGIEAMLTGRINQGLFGRISYSYLEPDALTAFNPAQQLKFVANYEFGNASASLIGKLVNRLYAENNFGSPLPDYFIMNFNCEYNLDWGKINLKLNNLLDRKYNILNNYVAPGFNVLLGINYFYN